jgi:probable HAF family extracellular repeat protein
MVDLGTLGGSNSEAVDVNDAGQVVGSAQTEHFPTSRAFSWTAAGGMIDLGTLDNSGSPSPGSAANAVNANGLVVGLSQLQGPNFTAVTHAFTWSAGAGLSDLGTLGGDNSSAKAVNDHGQVAGTSQAPDGVYHAFSWTAAGGMVDLGELGLDTAVVINNSGQIAGTTVGGAARAVLWTLAVPFASMTAKALVVVPPGAGNDSFVLDTTLVPGSGGNGIDPAREPVTLTLAGTRIALPAGALRHTPHLDIFVGKVNGGMLTLTIQPAGNGFRLFAHGSGFDLPAPHLPLTVELTIGDDAGVTDATARVVPPG